MKVKNLNPVERHVEKAVLAVAALGSLYLVWSTYSNPVQVDENVNVTASEVEPKITAAVQSLQAKMRDAREKQRFPAVPQDPNSGYWVRQFEDNMKSPFPARQLAAVPRFGPLNVEATPGKRPGGGEEGVDKIQIATPDVPAPIGLTVTSHRAVVVIEPPKVPGANPAVQPATAQLRSATWVRGEATFPMDSLVASIRGVGKPTGEVIPVSLQRITFADVEVERDELGADGWKNKWTRVKTNPAEGVDVGTMDISSMGPQQRQETLNALDQLFVRLTNPAFYPEYIPPAPEPRPQPIPVRNRPGEMFPEDPVEGGWEEGRSRPVVRQPVRPPPRQPVRQPVRQPDPPEEEGWDERAMAEEGFINEGGIGLPGRTVQNQTLESAKQQATIPVAFYDDTVQPGKTYRYRMRVKLYNPLFGLELPLKDPKAKNQPYIYSPWVEMPKSQPVEIEPDMYYFLTRGGFGGTFDEVSVRIFKWQDGKWNRRDESLAPGAAVGSVRNELDGNPVDYRVGQTVVDIVKNGDNTRVVFMDDDGSFVVRDLNTDMASSKRAQLDALMRPKPAAAMPPGAVNSPL